MRIAVAGGTGLVGRHVVEALARSGHEPTVLARSRGVDLVTGEGLADALRGVEAVVDVCNLETVSGSRATAFFTAATQHLLRAGSAADLRHHVVLSIVGVDRVATGYYRAKLRQEDCVRGGPLPWTVVRATQLHEFPGQLLDRMRGPVALLPTMRIQPVAAAEVAARLAEVVTGTPLGDAPELAGPEVHDLVDLARRTAALSGRPRRVVGLRVPGRGWRAMREGALLPAGAATSGGTTFDEWAAARSSPGTT